VCTFSKECTRGFTSSGTSGSSTRVMCSTALPFTSVPLGSESWLAGPRAPARTAPLCEPSPPNSGKLRSGPGSALNRASCSGQGSASARAAKARASSESGSPRRAAVHVSSAPWRESITPRRPASASAPSATQPSAATGSSSRSTRSTTSATATAAIARSSALAPSGNVSGAQRIAVVTKATRTT
jgi:hypothetical protein